MTKTKAIECLKGAGALAFLSGYLIFLTFCDRIPVILAWMDNDMLLITGLGCAFLCVLCLIYPAIYGLQLVINKLVGAPVTNDQWEKDLKESIANWFDDIKKEKK